MLHDLRHSIRLLRRTPGFSFVAIAILALGIGANTAVFSLVNALVLQPRQGRIDAAVGVFDRSRVKAEDYRDFSYPQYLDLRDRGGVFDSLMAHTFTTVGIREGERTRSSFAAVVSSNYFSTLGIPMATGRAFSTEEERPGAGIPVIVASYAAWRRSGFDPQFVGSTVRVNATDVTVVGITPKGFAGTMTIVSPEWWLPIGMYDRMVNEMFRPRATGLDDRLNGAFNLVGVLKPGTTPVAAEKALDVLAVRLATEYPASDKDRAFVLASLPRMSVSSRPQTDSGPAAISMLLAGMAALVLVVVCLNLANLLLARGAARRREIAIRQALGSGRSRIVRQLLVEGLVLSSIGASAGLLLAWWATNALGASLGGTLPLGIEVVVVPSPRMFVAAAGLTVFSTVFFALGPAWSLSRPMVQGDLRGEQSRATRWIGTGPALVIGQLAVSVALVAAGGLFVRAAVNAATADPGFSMNHQLVFGMDPSLAGYSDAQGREMYARVLETVRAMPGVEQASLASTVPFGEMSEGRVVTVPGDTRKFDPAFDIVSSGYFETLRVPVLRGRTFTAAEDQPSSARTAVVDTRLAQVVFGGADPIGRIVRMPVREGDTDTIAFTIVGVVPSIRHDLFDNAGVGAGDLSGSHGHIYTPLGSHYRASLTMHVRTADAAPDASMVPAVQKALRQVDPKLPVLTARTMTNLRDASISEWSVRAAAWLFSAFALLALVLATIGVYGLKAYEVARRTREIGIRIALGATARDVIRLVLGEGAKTTLVGVAIGLLLAAGTAKLVSGMLYRVNPFDPAVLAIAVTALGAAAMVACYVPARRATRVAPLEALRTE
ncbi:MAG TPA: ABC transporter permease [Vicinamibacterales bacterium]